MGLAELRADLKLWSERLDAMKPEDVDVRQELKENVVPMFEAMFDEQAKHEEHVDLIEDAVDELIDGAGEVIHPETSNKFRAVLELGKALCKELEAQLPKMNDVARKRIKLVVKAYRQGAEVLLSEILPAITLDPDEPDDDEEGNDDELEDGDPGDAHAGRPQEADDDELAADSGEV